MECGQRLAIADGIVSSDICVIARTSGTNQIDELVERHFPPVCVYVDLVVRILGPVSLKLDDLRADPAFKILRRPAAQGWPVRHLAGQDDGPVRGVVAIQKLLPAQPSASFD